MRYLDNNRFIGASMKALGIVMIRYNVDIEDAACGTHNGDLIHEMMQEGVDQIVAERIVSDINDRAEKFAHLMAFEGN